jgi:hypothetical protein
MRGRAQTHDEQIHLGPALAGIVRSPFATLIGAWNWKAAAVSAILRAATFFASNLRADSHSAVRAMLVEAAFATVAAGLMGAITQQLRATRPVWATMLVIWLALPATMLAAQFTWHRAMGTPHLRVGLIASFCFASVASGFNWYAMRRGAMLAGTRTSSVAGDLRALPHILLDFVLAGPRALLRRER